MWLLPRTQEGGARKGARQANSEEVTMPGPNSQSPYEGNLSGSFSDHPRSNKWTDHPMPAATWETGTMESHAMNAPRGVQATSSPSWDSTIIVQTGTTKGGNGANYDSSLPNH